jgi:hypothetical protein
MFGMLYLGFRKKMYSADRMKVDLQHVGKPDERLQFVLDQTLELCLLAVESDPYVFKFVKPELQEQVKDSLSFNTLEMYF